jgi:hypothetical protein
LHAGWIERCANYLTEAFGSRIGGATVVDYAFGRGNWSVAFARAGASRVHAIDASRSNVTRFRVYCEANRLENIEVTHGNILDKSLDIKPDIIWIYGILHHIDAADKFVSFIASLARDRRSLFLFYAYDAGSLLAFVANTLRNVLYCKIELAFRRLSPYLSPLARLRARDDLTAPHVAWHSIASLSTVLRRNGIDPVREVRGFGGQWRLSKPRREFAPLHMICRVGTLKRRAVRAAPVPVDLDVLKGMTDALLSLRTAKAVDKRRIAIGLVNTHVSMLHYSRSVDEFPI